MPAVAHSFEPSHSIAQDTITATDHYRIVQHHHVVAAFHAFACRIDEQAGRTWQSAPIAASQTSSSCISIDQQAACATPSTAIVMSERAACDAAELFHWIMLSSMSVYTNRQPAPGLLVPLQCQYLQHLYLLDFSIESCF